MSEKTESGNRERGAGTHTRRPEKSEGLAVDLSTMTEARKSLASLTVQYLSGEISETQLRATTYAFNALIKAMMHEKTAELERRIKKLEERDKGKK